VGLNLYESCEENNASINLIELCEPNNDSINLTESSEQNNDSINLTESCEQNNESITKSSGFSSFSSLLSSNDHQVLLRARSSSLPPIPYATSSSNDSSNFSYNDQLHKRHEQHRSNSVTEKPISHLSYQSNSQQSSTTCFQGECSINEEKDENQINDVQKRVKSKDVIKDEETNNMPVVTKEQKRRSGSNYFLFLYFYLSKENFSNFLLISSPYLFQVQSLLKSSHRLLISTS